MNLALSRLLVCPIFYMTFVAMGRRAWEPKSVHWNPKGQGQGQGQGQRQGQGRPSKLPSRPRAVPADPPSPKGHIQTILVSF